MANPLPQGKYRERRVIRGYISRAALWRAVEETTMRRVRHALMIGLAAAAIGWGSMAALAFNQTQAVAQSQLTALETSINAGTAAVINIYSGTLPTDADTALGAQVLLSQNVCNASVFSTKTDAAPGALGTFAAISDDTSADATGTASFFRLLTQSGGTVIAQGTVGTATSDLIFNTVSFTSGSTVSITSATITIPEG